MRPPIPLHFSKRERDGRAPGIGPASRLRHQPQAPGDHVLAGMETCSTWPLPWRPVRRGRGASAWRWRVRRRPDGGARCGAAQPGPAGRRPPPPARGTPQVPGAAAGGFRYGLARGYGADGQATRTVHTASVPTSSLAAATMRAAIRRSWEARAGERGEGPAGWSPGGGGDRLHVVGQWLLSRAPSADHLRSSAVSPTRPAVSASTSPALRRRSSRPHPGLPPPLEPTAPHGATKIRDKTSSDVTGRCRFSPFRTESRSVELACRCGRRLM